jgi:hypothetical protein
MKIRWRAFASDIREAIPPKEVRKQFGIYHPISTSVSLRADLAEDLKKALSLKFARTP